MSYDIVEHRWPLEGDELEQAAYMQEHWRLDCEATSRGETLPRQKQEACRYFKERFYGGVTNRLRLYEPKWPPGAFNISPDGTELIGVRVEAITLVVPAEGGDELAAVKATVDGFRTRYPATKKEAK